MKKRQKNCARKGLNYFDAGLWTHDGYLRVFSLTLCSLEAGWRPEKLIFLRMVSSYEYNNIE